MPIGSWLGLGSRVKVRVKVRVRVRWRVHAGPRGSNDVYDANDAKMPKLCL